MRSLNFLYEDYFSAINFLFSTTFSEFHKFEYVVHSFLLNSRTSLISFLPWPSSHSVENCSVFHEFVGFMLLLKFSFSPWWSDRVQGVPSFLQFSCICWVLFCYRVCGQFWKKVLWDTEKVLSFVFGWNILQISVILIYFITSVRSIISIFSFCLSIGKNEVLKTPSINVGGLMCDLSFTDVSFTNVTVLKRSSWWIFHLVSMKCPFPSLLINFGWKSTLLDIKIAIPACFLDPFAWKTISQPFTLK